MSTFSPQAWYGQGEFFAPNPEWNAVISYHLRDGASARASIDVLDATGKTIRTLTGPTAKGVNRVVWDLRYAPPVDSANLPAAGGRGAGAGGGGRGGAPPSVAVGFPGGGDGGGRGGAPNGPLVMPGTYGVRVTVPGTAAVLSGRVVVEADPLPKFRTSDRVMRQALLMRVYDWTKALGLARAAARALTAQPRLLEHIDLRQPCRLVIDNHRPASSRHLLDAARNRQASGYDRSIDVLVSRLRRKIDADDSDEASSLIKTVRGQGYMFVAPVTVS